MLFLEKVNQWEHQSPSEGSLPNNCHSLWTLKALDKQLFDLAPEIIVIHQSNTSVKFTPRFSQELGEEVL